MPEEKPKSRYWNDKAKERSKRRNAYFVIYHLNRRLGAVKINGKTYNEMFESQKGLCAICGKPETAKYSNDKTKVKRLSVDHCHTTDKIRGLLCFLCNRGLGYFKDNQENLAKAIKYLQQPT